MKNIKTIIGIAMAGALLATLCSCGGGNPDFTVITTKEGTTIASSDPVHSSTTDTSSESVVVKKDVEGITFDNGFFECDGNPHSIEIKGTLPEGITVSYDVTNMKEVGVYTVTASFTGTSEEYNTPAPLKANIIITRSTGALITSAKSFTFESNKASFTVEQNIDEINLEEELTLSYNASLELYSDSEYRNKLESNVAKLEYGLNTIYILVKSQDEQTTNKYTLSVTRKDKCTISVDSNGGSEIESKDVSAGYILTEEDLVTTRENCTLEYFTVNDKKVTFPLTVEASVKLTAVWSNTVTVNYYKQNIDGTFSNTPSSSDEVKGIVGDYTAIPVPLEEGFLVEPFVNVLITTELNQVLNIKLDRNSYSLTCKSNQADIKVAETHTLPYESTVSLSAPIVAGYTFNGWYNANTKVSDASSFMYEIKGNAELTAKYTPQDNVKYTVRHFKENVGGGYMLTPSETEELTGTAGTTVAITPKSYTGFNPADEYEVYIKGDGTAAINVCYQRDIHRVTIQEGNEGESNKTTISTSDYRYDTPLTLNANPKSGYVFNGWYVNDTKISTDSTYLYTVQSDVTLEARYAKTVKYTVKHFVEQMPASESATPTYNSESTEEKYGAVNANTLAEAKNLTGFTAQAFTQETIKLDESTIISIYYNRNKYTLETRYKLSDSEDSVLISSKEYAYGFTVSLNAESKTGYKFLGWYDGTTQVSPNSSYNYAIGTGNKTIVAKYEKIPSYQVKHVLQLITENVSDPVVYDTEHPYATDTLYGDAGSETKATARDIAGFNAQSITQKAISGDDSTEITILYTRTHYNFVFKYKLSDSESDNQLESKDTYYGQCRSYEATPKDGYKFLGWYNGNAKITAEYKVTYTMENSAVTLVAKYAKIVQYTVEYYTLNLGKYVISDMSNYTLHSSEKKDGMAGAETEAKAKAIEGFEVQPITQVTITDETTVVKVKYTRNTYNYTILHLEEGNPSNILHTTTGTAQYGGTFSDDFCGQGGYDFVNYKDKDDVEILSTENLATFSMPAGDYIIHKWYKRTS